MLDVTGSGRQSHSIDETIDLDSPRLACRVDWGFEPAQITLLILVFKVNDGSLLESPFQVDIDSTMTPHVSSSNSDALRLEMRESLQAGMSQMNKCVTHKTH